MRIWRANLWLPTLGKLLDPRKSFLGLEVLMKNIYIYILSPSSFFLFPHGGGGGAFSFFFLSPTVVLFSHSHLPLSFPFCVSRSSIVICLFSLVICLFSVCILGANCICHCFCPRSRHWITPPSPFCESQILLTRCLYLFSHTALSLLL